jgi:phage baseplate assembly protein gpV
MANLSGRYPGIVRSYDAASRTCRVEIEGITNGADSLPLAEIEPPIGSRSKGNHATDIEILEGDTVWLSFIKGDPRYPIITGYRNPQSGNATGRLSFHQTNVTIAADTELVLSGASIKINGDVEITGKVKISGSELTHNGKDVGEHHKHDSVQSGSGNTGEPI